MSFPGQYSVDLSTFSPKKVAKKDYCDLVKVMDYLENLHIIGSYPYFGYEGVPEVMSILEGVAIVLRESSKFHWGAYQNDCEIFIIEMAQAVGCEIMGACMASPPLAYDANAVDAALGFAEAGFPVAVLSGSVHGEVAPRR